MSYIGPMTQEIIDGCIREFKKKDTKDKVDRYLLTPIMDKVSEKIFYYYIIFMLIQVIIIILLFYSIYSKNKI